MQRCAVLGSPISHSLSPLLHRAAYEALDLDDWRYDAFDIGQPELSRFIAGLTTQWRGLSLTMPLKQTVIPMLDEISPIAEQLQSVNTVIVSWPSPGGPPHLAGGNTDVAGIENALRGPLTGTDGSGLRGCVLGAGATAASGLAGLARLGVREVALVARRPDDARSGLGHLGASLGLDISFSPWSEAARLLAAADVVVSSVPAGATDEIADELASAAERSTGILLDVVYDPWPTKLARAALAQGGRVISGIEMLLHQAVAQVEAMTGCDVAPLDQMRAALAARPMLI